MGDARASLGAMSEAARSAEEPARIRPGGPGDLAGITELYNYYVIHTPITFDIDPFTVEGRREWISHYHPSGPHRLFVAVAGELVVGYATSSAFRTKPAYATSVEVSVYCHADRRGQGLGSALYAALFDALSGEDLHRAVAGITLPNEASVAIHRRFGFTEVGVHTEVGRKQGRYWDVLFMERPLP
jgi:phosphinothricin acetyltransferase